MSMDITNRAITAPPSVRPHGMPPRGLDIDTRSRLFEGRFGRLFRALPPADFGPDDQASQELLEELAQRMIHEVDCPKDGEDDEESGIPAAYTYLGQFIDHDITFDPSSSLMRQNDPDALIDFRTPRLDLDSVYGRGLDDQPYIYDHEAFVVGDELRGSALKKLRITQDLPRASNGRAIIGDPRNDENAIVSQLQGLFLQFHNRYRREHSDLTFEEVQQEVRFHYQWIVTQDFLKRIVSRAVLQRILPHLAREGASANVVDTPPILRLYKPARQAFMPLEFSAAAYRFGHSMVRPGYRLNDDVGPLPIFALTSVPKGCQPPTDTLRGFRPINPTWGIDWARFIDFERRPAGLDTDPVNAKAARTQLAYKIDPSLVDPLANLDPSITGPNAGVFKSLAARNLVRGWRMRLPSGQSIALALGAEPLSDEDILIGSAADDAGSLPSIAKDLPGFRGKCPLWTYILAEAAHGFRTAPEDEVVQVEKGARRIATAKLGEVGGTIVVETFAGMMLDDRNSFWNLQPKWQPNIPPAPGAGADHFDFRGFVAYALGR